MSQEKRQPPRAIALKYDESATAPSVVAKGRGEIAEGILALAEKHDVPVREDGDLLQLLYACDLGDEIPVDLYEAVAELLAYLYELNQATHDEGSGAA